LYFDDDFYLKNTNPSVEIKALETPDLEEQQLLDKAAVAADASSDQGDIAPEQSVDPVFAFSEGFHDDKKQPSSNAKAELSEELSSVQVSKKALAKREKKKEAKQKKKQNVLELKQKEAEAKEQKKA